MVDFLRFWLVLQVLGLVALPLAWRLLAFLPDRGYTMAKALGLLGTGYILWLAASFGLLRNSVGGVVLALVIFTAVSGWFGRFGLQRDSSGQRPLLSTLRGQVRYILVAELLFLLAMAFWAYFRAYNPDIAGTEKPMEFAFLNGILNSQQFPPRDPWLAGYGISYYYFGYVLLNLLVLLTGIKAGIAFNLGLASIFALTLFGAFGIGSGLVRADQSAPAGRLSSVIYGALAALFVGIMGNLEGVLEVLHARGLTTPALLGFFDVKELANAPQSGSWNPGTYWWWWRASRTIHDYNFAGTANQEVIDEFPLFSFLLGDMHPHVLALPFVLLAIALALNLMRRPATLATAEPGWRAALSTIRTNFGLDGWGFVLYAIALGAIAFLNTWDFPIYVFLVTLVFALRRGLNLPGMDGQFWLEVGGVFLGLLFGGVLAFLPFYLTFSSQASGFLPNIYNPTRFAQYFLMFGPFLVALVFLLVVAYRRIDMPWKVVLLWIAAAIIIPLIFLVAVVLIGSFVPGIRQWVEQVVGAPRDAIVAGVAGKRLSTPGTWLAIAVLLGTTGALASRVWGKSERKPGQMLLFVLALFFTALLLTLGVEFVYLRDTFSTRMNTVFKFYYQAWILMALGSAYALYYVRSRASGPIRILATVLVAIFVLGGMIYPAFAIPSKANNFQGTPTLDGADFVARYRPDEAAVIAWLEENASSDAVIVEAPGGSYSDFNTISAHTGRATLLGWGGHELQWRGSYDIPGEREPQIETIYRNRDPDRISEIVNTLGIDYLIVGPREADKYGLPGRRLPVPPETQNLWEPVFEQGSYSIYRWRGD